MYILYIIYYILYIYTHVICVPVKHTAVIVSISSRYFPLLELPGSCVRCQSL